MKKAMIVIAFLLVGCSTLLPPGAVPNAQGCVSYCYPVMTNDMLFLSRTNVALHEGACWHGGILAIKDGDEVSVRYTTAVCSNGPQPAVTFVWFCSNQLNYVTRNLPANAVGMTWNIHETCSNCFWSVTLGYGTACPAPPLEGAQRASMIAMWDIVDGKLTTVKQKGRR